MFWHSKKNNRPENPSGILIVSSGGLGDTILFSFVLDRFKTLANRDETVTIVLPKESRKVAFLFDNSIRIVALDYDAFRENRAYMKKIAREFYMANYRLVISTDFLRHPRLDERIIKYCDAQEVVGMEARSWPKYDKELKKNRSLYNRLFYSGPIHQDKVLRWTYFADWLSGKKRTPPKLQLSDKQIIPGEIFLNPTVVLVPFSAVKAKQSAPELFVNIIDHLGYDYDFLVATTKKDLEANPEYKAIFNTEHIKIDTSSFEDLAPKIKNACLVVSVDTAAMHLAVAVGAPTICLASAAYVSEIVPYAPEITPDNVRFIYETMDCEGCLGSCHLPLVYGRFECVARINLNLVLNTIDELLEK